MRLLVATLLAGCAFPEPTVVDLSVSDTAVVDSGRAEIGDAPATDSRTEDTTVADTGSATDTMVADPCDRDGDGHRAPGGSCGGFDCDDGDKNANPGVMTHQTLSVAGKSHKGDWNCNGTVEKLVPINQSCPLTAGGACDGTKGFQGDPACGASGNYLTCKSNGLGCEGTVNTTMTIVQACK